MDISMDIHIHGNPAFYPVLELPEKRGIPLFPLRLSVPANVRVPGIFEGTVFVPGTAGAPNGFQK